MDFETLAIELQSTFPNLKILLHEPMKQHCTFRIGGAADIFVEPADSFELSELCAFLWENKVKPTIIGKGSNLLVSDEGVRGVVIHLGDGLSNVWVEDDCMYAESGVTLAHLAVVAKEHGLSGLEFAHGIPGTLGGAVYMNAGAYGGEMKDVITEVRYMNLQGFTGETEDLGFGYRKSVFTDSENIIVGAWLKLKKDSPETIHQRMMELWEKRSGSQPLDKPSAGSTFKRPVGGFAAAMIDEAGLKGFSIGGAQVSEKHAGFVINTGNATCADVKALIAHIQSVVQEQTGKKLEPEVKFIGE